MSIIPLFICRYSLFKISTSCSCCLLFVLPLCVLKGELVTASKAIIEKEYQPRVIINKKGPNPFTKVGDQEMEDYYKEVEQKQKGTEGK